MAKAESNRRNALRSTGPKTPAGKAKVSKNAEKHGAYSEALFMLGEDQGAFDELRRGLVETIKPVGPMECRMVERLASLWWRMERTKTAANQDLWMGARIRLKPTLERVWASSPDDPFEEATALDKDECRFPGAWDMDRQDRLLRHEMTLERAFFKTLHELERVQARRHGVTVPTVPVLDLNISGPQD